MYGTKKLMLDGLLSCAYRLCFKVNRVFMRKRSVINLLEEDKDTHSDGEDEPCKEIKDEAWEIAKR